MSMKEKIQKIIKKLEDMESDPFVNVHTRYGSGYVDGLETAINRLKKEFDIEN